MPLGIVSFASSPEPPIVKPDSRGRPLYPLRPEPPPARGKRLDNPLPSPKTMRNNHPIIIRFSAPNHPMRSVAPLRPHRCRRNLPADWENRSRVGYYRERSRRDRQGAPEHPETTGHSPRITEINMDNDSRTTLKRTDSTGLRTTAPNAVEFDGISNQAAVNSFNRRFRR